MLLTLEQVKAIDPTSIWLEITADKIDRATPNHQLYSNPTGLNNAQINQFTPISPLSLCHRINLT